MQAWWAGHRLLWLRLRLSRPHPTISGPLLTGSSTERAPALLPLASSSNLNLPAYCCRWLIHHHSTSFLTLGKPLLLFFHTVELCHCAFLHNAGRHLISACLGLMCFVIFLPKGTSSAVIACARAFSKFFEFEYYCSVLRRALPGARPSPNTIGTAQPAVCSVRGGLGGLSCERPRAPRGPPRAHSVSVPRRAAVGFFCCCHFP